MSVSSGLSAGPFIMRFIVGALGDVVSKMARAFGQPCHRLTENPYLIMREVGRVSTVDLARITGFIELADPLSPNLTSLTTLTPLSFSFSDGVNTITNATALFSLFQV